MKLNSSYPVIQVISPVNCAKFFVDHFGFIVTWDATWYVSLLHEESGFELAFVYYLHETIPAQYRNPHKGTLLNFEVPEVDSEHDRLVSEGLQVVRSLRTEEFPQRHAQFAGPEGIIIDLIQVTSGT